LKRAEDDENDRDTGDHPVRIWQGKKAALLATGRAIVVEGRVVNNPVLVATPILASAANVCSRRALVITALTRALVGEDIKFQRDLAANRRMHGPHDLLQHRTSITKAITNSFSIN
jgi:hypothetical protein